MQRQRSDITINSSKTKNQRRQEIRKYLKLYQKLDSESQFVLHLVLVKHSLQGTPQQKQKQLRKRINKFFQAGQKRIDLENDEHFHQKRQADYRNLAIDNELILYGIDFLATKEIKKRLLGLHPQIIKLDDSHCKIVFPNSGEAREAMKRNMLHPQELDVKMQEQTDQAPRKWFAWKPYKYLVFERNLQCRYATQNQNIQTVKQSQQMRVYQRAKKQFEQSINTQGKQISKKIRFAGERTNRGRDRSRQKKRNRWNNENSRYGNNSRQNNNNSNPRNMQDEDDDDDFDIHSKILGGDHDEQQLIRELQNISLVDNSQYQSNSLGINNDSLGQFLNSENQMNLSVEQHGSEPEKIVQPNSISFSYTDYFNQTNYQESMRMKKKKAQKIVFIVDDE